MSTAPEPEFDLEKLFLPAWAQDSPQVNRYADFAGEDRAERKYDDRQAAAARRAATNPADQSPGADVPEARHAGTAAPKRAGRKSRRQNRKPSRRRPCR
jgi:hypothetical protein